MKEVKQSHGSVATSSLRQAEAINARGIFRVGYLVGVATPESSQVSSKKTLESVIHLTVPPKTEGTGKTQYYFLDGLKDLQSKLMLIAGKAAQGKAKEVETFVEVGIIALYKKYLCLISNIYISNLKCMFSLDAFYSIFLIHEGKLK